MDVFPSLRYIISPSTNQQAGVDAPVSSRPIKDILPRPKRKSLSDWSIQEELEKSLLSVSNILGSNTYMTLSDTGEDIITGVSESENNPHVDSAPIPSQPSGNGNTSTIQK
ncbi:hypothetical protein Pcinc_022193 [Petrolisthes cinctipes]|uniref:Uncharacterized protein n=1 Tax=Petrolisthes cinctipes TaxID=88211 RepID=A0AAE1KH61_PETCI|nr:hypothetical protein Pcinc_022193 [Petrolisthes cinctipes]